MRDLGGFGVIWILRGSVGYFGWVWVFLVCLGFEFWWFFGVVFGILDFGLRVGISLGLGLRVLGCGLLACVFVFWIGVDL